MNLILLAELLRLRRRHLLDAIARARPYCNGCGRPHADDYMRGPR